MTRKVYVNITVKAVIRMNEGVEVSEVINEMDHSFSSMTLGAGIEDTEIAGFEVADSK